MSKNLLQIFSKYEPSDADRQWMLSATEDSIRLRYDKEQKIIEISASFPHIVKRPVLFRVEEDIRRTYELNFVHFCPRYPSELFSEAYIPDLLFETNRMGIVANGFFNNCHYRLLDGRLEIDIPFSESGIGLIYDAKTPTLMQDVIRREFGLEISVHILQEQGFDPDQYARQMGNQVREMSREAARAEKEYVQAQQAQAQQFAYIIPPF